jgi:hypothetical protein
MQTKFIFMKNLKKPLFCVACFVATSFYAAAQRDSTGMPGDNFSLQGALEMFKQSSSPEEFEKLINTESNNVNNLDLNGDGDIDYINVIDKTEKEVHAFVLQVAVSEKENQDIAVIELEKTGDTTAVLQIIGDEDIYGEQIIVEASDEGDEGIEENNFNTPQKGPAEIFFQPVRIVLNVFFWPCVRNVYRPVYRPWVSPYQWRYYPNYWRPWRPYAWHVFNPRRLYYSRHCAIVRTHRVVVAHRVYAPHRVTSVTVRTRTTVARKNYTITRTTRRTSVTGPGGNTRVRKTQNTSIQGRNNNIQRRNSSIQRRNGNGNRFTGDNTRGRNENKEGKKKGKGRK